MNYLDFFNLAEEPFSYLKTNPRYFYNAAQYRYAKAILNDGIMNKSAHLYLTGPRGSGKTTLLRVLEVDLRDDKHNLVFFTFAVRDLRSAYSFTRRLCKEMGIKTERSYVDMLDNFEGQVGPERKTVVNSAHQYIVGRDFPIKSMMPCLPGPGGVGRGRRKKYASVPDCPGWPCAPTR